MSSAEDVFNGRCLQRKMPSTEDVKNFRATRVLQSYENFVELCEFFRATRAFRFMRVLQSYENSLELREFSKRHEISLLANEATSLQFCVQI